jgi:protocatechuate 3,4-dioxygenase beta subunit
MRALLWVALIVLGIDSGSRSAFFENRLPESFQGATITGTVVDARTMRPLRGAIVSAGRVRTDKPDAPPNIAFRTGEDGKFTLRGVAPGVVSFTVMKAGYTMGPITSVRPAVDGERIDNVVLAVSPGAIVSGRVTDESGHPVSGMQVAVRTAKAPPGTRLSLLMGASARTTDDGRYFLGGLPAGDYTIAIGSQDDGAEIISSTTSVILDRATGEGSATRPPLVALSAGEERGDLDLVVRFRDRSVGPRRLNSGTATIQGKVVDPHGIAIGQTPVLLREDTKTASMLATRTDASGHFKFERVPRGAYVLGPARVGTSSGAGSGDELNLQIAAGSRIENVVLTATRGGTISGTVTDEFGDPASALVVAITRASIPSAAAITSSLTGVAAAQVSGRSTGTDVRGRYRITGLPPGHYVISVVPALAAPVAEVHFIDESGHDRVFPPASTFYPGVQTMSQASSIPVSENVDASGIDVAVKPVPMTTIAVTLTAGRPIGQVQLHQFLADDTLPILEKTTRTSESNVILDGRPGRYRLVASAEVPIGPDPVVRLWSTADVYTDVVNPASVTMTLEPGANLAGRIAFEGKEPNRQNAGAWLVATDVLPALPSTATGNATFEPATGRFSMDGVMPGRYVLNGGGAERGRSHWMLKAAIVNGRDVLDEAIDLRSGDDITDVRLTVTDRVTEISGTVLDAAGKPGAGAAWVLAFPVEKKHWWPGSRRLRAVRPGPSARYRISALPPGHYVVVTLTEALAEADLIASLPALAAGGVRVTLAEGDRIVQDLRTVRR